MTMYRPCNESVQLTSALVVGRRYENAEVALNTGMILHEMLRHEPLAKSLLHSDRLYDFIGYIDKTTFGIACDAQANFKVGCSLPAGHPESRLVLTLLPRSRRNC